MSEDEFVWWFERNPTGYLNIFLAEEAGALVGISSTASFRVWLEGGEHLVPFSLNVLTHPSHRGRGIFTSLELANEADAIARGCRFMLSFPNRLSAPIFLRRLGWRAGKVAPLAIKVRDPLKVLAVAAHLPALRGWDLRAHALTDWSFRRSRPASVEPIDEFGGQFDVLWRRSCAYRSWGLVKDASYLNWRFLAGPVHRYSCFRIAEAGSTVGYLVTGIAEKRGLRLGYVADLFVAREAAHLVEDALAAVDANMISADVDAVLAFAQPDPDERRRRSGFFYLPTPKRLRFIYKVLDRTLDGLPWAQPLSWRFELGDLDFF
jgi:hypothetical protein